MRVKEAGSVGTTAECRLTDGVVVWAKGREFGEDYLEMVEKDLGRCWRLYTWNGLSVGTEEVG